MERNTNSSYFLLTTHTRSLQLFAMPRMLTITRAVDLICGFSTTDVATRYQQSIKCMYSCVSTATDAADHFF